MWARAWRCARAARPLRARSARLRGFSVATPGTEQQQLALDGTIREVVAAENSGKPVRTRGWVRSVRGSKRTAFVELNDGTRFSGVQIVAKPDDVKNITVGCSLEVTGTLNPGLGKTAALEINADPAGVRVVGGSDPDYPLQKKYHTPEFLREQLHLRARTRSISAALRARSEACAATYDFFGREGFVQIHAPVLTPNDCEGGGETFQVAAADGASPDGNDFFGSPMYLTVSSQLYAEAAAAAFDRVYSFGPTFRAERSQTTTHLSEFWMVEPEMAYARLADAADVAEAYIKSVLARLRDRCEEDMQYFASRQNDANAWEKGLSAAIDKEYIRMTHKEAVDTLIRSGTEFEIQPSFDDDLATEHERYLAETHCAGVPVFVTDYPTNVKPFYMKRSEDGQTAKCLDLLFPGVGELAGGSEREEDAEALGSHMREKGVQPEGLEWYMDLRRFGSTPRAGFGVGFERLVQFATGVANVRDVTFVPRHVRRKPSAM